MRLEAKNQKGGFLKLVILIVVALLLLKYLHISLSDVFDWTVKLLNKIFS